MELVSLPPCTMHTGNEAVLKRCVLEFHGMDNGVLMKALNILVKRGKAQIFGSEDSLGVKFF